MRYPLWKTVALSTPWREVDGRAFLIVAEDRPGTGILIGLSSPHSTSSLPVRERAGNYGVTAQWMRLDQPEYPPRAVMQASAPIGPHLRKLMGPRATAISIPPIDFVDDWLTGTTFGARVLNPGRHTLDHTTILDYALARLAGERPTVTTLDDRRTAALKRADEIKAEYGELMTDIVYRIDYPALFDPVVPATEAFHVALVQCDTRAENPPIQQLEGLVNGLEITYSLARDNAETLAERHLPEEFRDDARRASKAANLAANAATDGERGASLAQVKSILDSLALYYMPKIDGATRAIEGAQEPT